MRAVRRVSAKIEMRTDLLLDISDQLFDIDFRFAAERLIHYHYQSLS